MRAHAPEVVSMTTSIEAFVKAVSRDKERNMYMHMRAHACEARDEYQ